MTKLDRIAAGNPFTRAERRSILTMARAAALVEMHDDAARLFALVGVSYHRPAAYS